LLLHCCATLPPYIKPYMGIRVPHLKGVAHIYPPAAMQTCFKQLLQRISKETDYIPAN